MTRKVSVHLDSDLDNALRARCNETRGPSTMIAEILRRYDDLCLHTDLPQLGRDAWERISAALARPIQTEDLRILEHVLANRCELLGHPLDSETRTHLAGLTYAQRIALLDNVERGWEGDA